MTYKIHKYRNWETGFPGDHGGGFCPVVGNDTQWWNDFTDVLWGWFCSDSTFKTADSEKPKILILLGSIRDPLYFFFLKVLSPTTSKQVSGPSRYKYLGWWQGGESGVSENLNSCLSGVTAGESWLHFLSLVQKERPQEWPAAFSPVTRPHKQSSLPPGPGGNGGGKGNLLRTARRARHREDGRTARIRRSWSHTWY